MCSETAPFHVCQHLPTYCVLYSSSSIVCVVSVIYLYTDSNLLDPSPTAAISPHPRPHTLSCPAPLPVREAGLETAAREDTAPEAAQVLPPLHSVPQYSRAVVDVQYTGIALKSHCLAHICTNCLIHITWCVQHQGRGYSMVMPYGDKLGYQMFKLYACTVHGKESVVQ